MKTQPRKNSLWFIFICIFSLILASQAWSETYYVDAVNGIEDNDGLSPATAWKTIEGSVAKLQDNDQLVVAPGTYIPAVLGGNTGAVDVTQTGVTIQGAPGVIIDGGGGATCWFYGFYITGSDVVLRDLELTRFNCDNLSAAIHVQSGSNNRIETCVIHDSDNGIVIQDASPQILRNWIHDNRTGIKINQSSGTIQPEVTNNLIFNSATGTDMAYGIYISAFSTGATVSPKIYHNTISGVTQDGIYMSQESPTSPNVAIKYNNITYHAGYGINNVFSTAADVDYNCFWGNTSGDATGATPSNSLLQAPLYINYPANDFQLQSGSPCRDHIPYTVDHPVSVDIGLLPRPQPALGNFDVGAYEFPAALYTLTVSIVGNGSVSLSPSGVTYGEGTQVTLTPVPDNGWAFSQWGGDLSGSENPTTITMDADKTVTATFVQKYAPDTPTADNPQDEATFPDGATVTLDTSDYNDADGDSHVQSWWEVKRADNGEYISGYPLPSSLDLTLHDITAGLAPGLKYIWRVGYEDSDGNVTYSEEYAFKVGTSITESLPAIAAGKDLGDFGMISIVHWPDDPRPQAVFNIDYDPINYRIGTYDAMTGSYIEFGEGLEMEPGRCYWILAREGLTVNFDGIPVSLTSEVFVALDYNATTQNGWNMVAPPNEADYFWSFIQVWEDVGGTLTSRGTVQSLADTNPYIDRQLWRWENGGYVADAPDLDPNSEMKAYAGYWVKAKKAGVFLKFDVGARVSSLGMPQTLMAKAWQKTVNWLNKLNLFSGEAIADNDSPPMPPAGLDENTVDPVFGGCYVDMLEH
jgi:parallel beta-helix repeat protein